MTAELFTFYFLSLVFVINHKKKKNKDRNIDKGTHTADEKKSLFEV